MSPPENLYLLRGPILVVAVIASALWPYVSTWSAQSIIQLLVASIGAMWSVADFFRFTESNLRQKVSSLLDHFVLDDFLRVLYDPDIGIVPCMVGSFVGASGMYGLRLDEEQRTKLVQASLWSTKEEAHSILLDAGGTKALLPEFVKAWLGGEQATQRDHQRHRHRHHQQQQQVDVAQSKPRAIMVETVEEIASDSSSVSDYHTHLEECRAEPNADRHRMTPNTSSGDFSHSYTDQEPTRPDEVCFMNGKRMRIPPGIPTDPVMVMFSIVKDMAIEKVRPLFASIPESRVELVGSLAAIGMCAQFLLRFRRERSMLGTFSALCLSGTAAGAFTTMLVRHAVLGTVHDLHSLKMVSVAILSRSFDRLKWLIAKDKRWQSALALVVLSLFGKSTQFARPTLKFAATFRS